MSEGYQVQRRGKLKKSYLLKLTLKLILKLFLGIIQVKGKGSMETFFVYSKSDQLQENAQDLSAPSAEPINKSSSLAEVMFNITQVIKKQNLANSLSVPNSNKSKPNRLSLSFNSKQSTLSNLANALPLRGSLSHSTRSANIGDYNQMKSSSCKLQRIRR